MIDLAIAQKIQDWYNDCIKITHKNKNVDYCMLSDQLWLYICAMDIIIESGILDGKQDCTDLVAEYVEFIEQQRSVN